MAVVRPLPPERAGSLSRRSVLGVLGSIPAALLLTGAARGRARPGWRAERWRAAPAAVHAEAAGEHTLTLGRARFQTNASGLLLWRLCDGRHTGDELVAALAAHGGIDARRAARDVASFLGALAQEGLVTRA